MLDYRARYYDPYLNRFISPDTIIPDTSSPQDWNRYSHVRNNPLKYTDPSGHCLTPFCLGEIAVVAVLLFATSGCASDSATTVTPQPGSHFEVTQHSDKIEVNAEIQIYGDGASDTVAQEYELGIERVWNNKRDGTGWNDEIETNSFYNGIPVVFDVDVYHQEPENGWARNLIGEPIRPSHGEGDAPNMIFVEPGIVPEGLHPYLVMNDGSYDWEWGVWWADMGSTLTAHEAGHIFGMLDYYGDDGRPVRADHHNWIMGNPNGQRGPGTGEIEALIGSAIE